MRVSHNTPRLSLPTHPRERDPTGGPVSRASSGDASLDGLILPNIVEDGGNTSGEVTVVLSPGLIDDILDTDVGEPDICDPVVAPVGFYINVQVLVDGNPAGDFTDCIISDTTVDITAPIPSISGDYPVTVILYGANSGNEIDRTTRWVTVPSTVDPGNGDDNGGGDPGGGDDNGGGGPGNGGGNGGDAGPIQRATGLILLLIVAVLLLRMRG